MPNVAYCQSPPQTDPYVYVLVWGDHPLLQPAISTYEQDLENDGFSVEIPENFGNTAETVREFLQSEALTHEIAGAVLIGDVPYANYEMEFRNVTRINPCDLYYMDLDGNWTDSDGNGVYDMHTNETGDLEPEIWVGRLHASTITWGDEDELLINYFDKNHRFRIGNLTLPRRALAYIDDEFLYSAENVNSSLNMIYGNETTLVIDPETTNATDYKNRLNDPLGYEWLHLVAHGHSKKHYFYTSKGWGFVSFSDIRNIDPHIFFYNIMACDTADYSRTDYIGSSYLFADTYGLLVVGSTKLHHVWDVKDFYEPIAEGKCIGQALKEWIEKHGELDRFTSYGLTILGDPTLRTPHVSDVAVTAITTSKSVVVQNGTIVVLPSYVINVTVENKGPFTETFDVTAYAGATTIDTFIIDTFINITLTSRNSTTITFIWNTIGVPSGNYTIYAQVSMLPGETDTSDNIIVNGIVEVVGSGVGGIYIPVNKLELLAPYIGLTILLAATVTTVVYVKKKKEKNRD